MNSNNNKGTARKILIPVLILALLVGGFFGIKQIRRARTTADVMSVSALNWGYMEDPMSINGSVYEEDVQNIYPSITQIITEVYVTEGQTVKKGDPLLAYDMESQKLTLQIQELTVEKAKQNLARAQASLNALYSTTPVSVANASGISTGGKEVELPSAASQAGSQNAKPDHKLVESAWTYLDKTNIKDYYLDPIVTVLVNNRISNTTGEDTSRSNTSGTNPSTDNGGAATDNNAADSGNANDDNGSDDSSASDDSTADDGNAADDGSTADNGGSESTDDGGAEASDDNATNDSTSTPDAGTDNSGSGDSAGTDTGNDSAAENPADTPTEEYVPGKVPDPGTIDNPYRYLVTEDGRIYGSFLNEFRKLKNAYAVIEIREGNKIDGALIGSLTLNSNKIKERKDDEYWYVILRTDENSSPDGVSDSDSGMDATDIFDTDGPIGYTQQELAEAIRTSQKDLKDLDIEVRSEELKLKELQEQMENGQVLAKRDGVVTLVRDKDNPPQDGSPFLKVDAGSGVTIQGSISELLLDSVTIGQSISATDWDTGETYIGEITKIDDYPSDSTYYYGGGNPNSSYYNFLAYFDEAKDLTENSYFQMSLDVNSSSEDGIYLPNAYIRSDSKGKYVMKDVDGILTKEYVVCGKSYYGYVTEVKEGLTNDDYIAFPYGDGAQEGVHVSIASEEDIMYG